MSGSIRHTISLPSDPNVQIYVMKIPAFTATRVFTDIQKIIAGPFTSLFAAALLNPTSSDELANLGAHVAAASEKLDGDKIERLMRLLLDPNYVSIQRGDEKPEKLTENAVNMYFAGIEDVIQVAMEVAKYNFAGFPKLFASLIGQARERVAAG